MKKPLDRVRSVYTNSKTAIASASLSQFLSSAQIFGR